MCITNWILSFLKMFSLQKYKNVTNTTIITQLRVIPKFSRDKFLNYSYDCATNISGNDLRPILNCFLKQTKIYLWNQSVIPNNIFQK